MSVKNRYKILLVICTLIIFFAYYLLVHTNAYYLTSKILKNLTNAPSKLPVKEKSLQKKYLVWTSQCKIVDIDPWDESIRKYVNPVQSIQFEKVEPLIRIEKRENKENVLRIREGNEATDCCYSIITRVAEKYGNHTKKADEKYSKSTCHHFKNETVLSNTTEFIYVVCKEKRYKNYKNIHAVVPILPRVADRIENFKADRLNVLLVGIDSLSRLALQRVMPNTVKYFQQNQWVELKGYNKIGDNTFPNVLAILTGRNLTVNSKICKTIGPNKKEPCRLIWDDFRENGYITAYAEDYAWISTFNYEKTGFVTQPTDYYLRPYILAGEKLFKLVHVRKHPVGFGPVSYVDSILNYAKDFAETFNDYNFFGLFWMNGYSHDDNDLAAAMDDTFKNFLTDLEEIGTYQNTLVVAFSDHGARFGKLRKTPVGYYEERLPFIYIWVPQWYRDQYPEKYENLLINGNRLTTPYDVYLTIYKLLNESGTSDACPNCNSLFEEVSTDRSCKDAAIDEKWCMCSSFKDVNPTDLLILNIGQFLFETVENTTQELLNKYNLNSTLCESRRLINIKRGFESISTDYHKIGERDFVLEIETHPGPATFEAKIKVSSTDMKLVNSISRLDSYAKVSDCVDIVELKYFCHCR